MKPHCIRAALALPVLALAACGKPQPPERERPPEPQAARATPPEAIGQPIDRAKAVEGRLRRAADAQRAAVDAATHG